MFSRAIIVVLRGSFPSLQQCVLSREIERLVNAAQQVALQESHSFLDAFDHLYVLITAFMGGAHDGEFPGCQVIDLVASIFDETQDLERFRTAAHESDQVWVPQGSKQAAA